MPKKTTTARGGAQRNRPKVKVQKSFELVRQTSDEQVPEEEQKLEEISSAEPTAASVSTVAAPEVKQSRSRIAREIRPGESASKSSVVDEVTQSESTNSQTGTAPKGSAAARLAARRQTMQKAQQRSATTLVTVEHYAYVRKDLLFIAILAAIMFSVIIILHFVPGIGS